MPRPALAPRRSARRRRATRSMSSTRAVSRRTRSTSEALAARPPTRSPSRPTRASRSCGRRSASPTSSSCSSGSPSGVPAPPPRRCPCSAGRTARSSRRWSPPTPTSKRARRRCSTAGACLCRLGTIIVRRRLRTAASWWKPPAPCRVLTHIFLRRLEARALRDRLGRRGRLRRRRGPLRVRRAARTADARRLRERLWRARLARRAERARVWPRRARGRPRDGRLGLARRGSASLLCAGSVPAARESNRPELLLSSEPSATAARNGPRRGGARSARWPSSARARPRRSATRHVAWRCARGCSPPPRRTKACDTTVTKRRRRVRACAPCTVRRWEARGDRDADARDLRRVR